MHENDRHAALIARALGHPTRLLILETLRDGEACVCHLEAVIGRRQAYISQQLSCLRAYGLITDRREGNNIYYALSDESLVTTLDALYEAAQLLFGGPFSEHTPVPVSCPCPKCRVKGTA